MPTIERRLSLRQAAQTVGCHVETLRRAVRAGELPATRHPTARGRGWQVLATDLDAFIKARRTS